MELASGKRQAIPMIATDLGALSGLVMLAGDFNACAIRAEGSVDGISDVRMQSEALLEGFRRSDEEASVSQSVLSSIILRP